MILSCTLFFIFGILLSDVWSYSINFLSYGDDSFKLSKARIEKEARTFGAFKEIFVQGPEDLDIEFRRNFSDVLKLPRGGGYWIWKMHLIEKALDKMAENDILVYADSGCTFFPQHKYLFDEYITKLSNSTEKSILTFQLSLLEKHWTKMELVNYFKVENNTSIINTGQNIATIIYFKNTPQLKKYFQLYRQTLTDNPELITDKIWMKQSQGFKENRHDQSIHSLIVKILDIGIIIPDDAYILHNDPRKRPIMATRSRI